VADALEQLAMFPVEWFCSLIAGHCMGVYIERGEAQTRLEKAPDVRDRLKARVRRAHVFITIRPSGAIL